MATQGGFGVDVKITVNSVLTSIAHVVEMEYPELEKVLAEVTGHGAAGGYEEWIATGKRRQSSFAMTLSWDIDDTSHEAIVDAFDSNEAVQMSIEDPQGFETISFSAHVFKMKRVGDQEDGFKCEVEVQPTGQPTISVGSV